MTRQEKIIKQIEALQAKLEKDMASALPKVFSQLSDEVIDIVAGLSLDPDDRARSLREIIALKRQIGDALVANQLYQTSVKSLLDGYKELAKLSDDFMGEVLDNYTRKQDLYEAILRTNVDITKNNLLGAGIKDNFSNAIREVLKANISGVANKASLRKTLAQFIEGTEAEKPFLERYITQVTNDSVMVFNREYLQTISEDLDINYYRYSGTIIGDTRAFCAARAGRIFKKAEVEKWPDLGQWQGRMPGTNKQTIFSYCGGYNCRHQLWPASDIVYQQGEEQGITGIR
jgi:hypothetical protein